MNLPQIIPVWQYFFHKFVSITVSVLSIWFCLNLFAWSSTKFIHGSHWIVFSICRKDLNTENK